MEPLFAKTKEGNPKAAMDELRILSDNCPACILAAIRQSGLQKVQLDEEGVNHGIDFEFDFKKELAEFWSVVNDAAYQAQSHHDY